MQNFGRLPIISDTTRRYGVVENPFGNEPEDENTFGFYIEEDCPVNGLSLLPWRFDTSEEARAFMLKDLIGIDENEEEI